jgi:glycine/D-amino acid oxidase-like deaminating enzyme/nitrite reductase/ring-hydroxylating ferredoxin subunit
MSSHSRATSVWFANTNPTSFPTLDRDLVVDVAIVGGGITGVTAALLLARQGQQVALIEKDRLGHGESGATSAHLTQALDTRYRQIMLMHGIDTARLVAEAQRSAIDRIARIASELRIDCDFARVPGWLYTESEEDVATVEEELEFAHSAALDVRLDRHPPLPFAVKSAVCFRNQARFHPLKYLFALADRVSALGAHLFEGAHVVEVTDGDPCEVTTERATVRARHVLLATDVPLNDESLFQTKLKPQRSYLIAVRVPRAQAVDGLFWDSEEPYHYTRSFAGPDGRLLIIGGKDHRVGTGDQAPLDAVEALEAYARERFDVEEVVGRWSGQIIEPLDGLAYIGPRSSGSRVHVATGYSGNGLTQGTLAAMILSDLVLDRANPFAIVYDPGRTTTAAAMDYIRRNSVVAVNWIRDHLTTLDANAHSLEEVPAGGGRIVAIGGEKYAVARDGDGTMHCLSPVCTHMGCDVAWNDFEKTWDCPCHGSRFDLEGHAVHGPATTRLEPKPVPEAVQGR